MANENEGVGDEVVEVTGCKKDIWPPNIESYFIGLMEEEVKKGNRQTTTLTRDAWRRIKEEMKIQFGKEYTYDQFKNKFNQLRGKWKDFNNLLKMETGLGYNSATGKIIATDDEWKKLCEKYKFAKQFKKKGCLKARFPILKFMLPYALKRQKYIPLACCVLHNFIKMEMQDDPLFTQYADENVQLEDEATNGNNNTEEHVPPQVTTTYFRQMATFRDRLAQRLWDATNATL